MNKCAFVIPLHHTHFDYGYYIYYYLLDKNADVYFVFTDDKDKDIFMSNINDKVNYFVLSDLCDIEIVKQNNSYITMKKIFALSKLYDKYDYISCIDSEIKFIGNNDFYNVMKNIVDTKIICCSKLNTNEEHTIKIIKSSLTNLTDKSYHETLQSLSQNFTLYTWWFNLPVYDCKNTEHFLKWINFNDGNLEKFNWFIFDNIIYNFYCILFHNYELKLITNCCYSSLEYCMSFIVENIDKNVCKLYWVSNICYHQNKIYYETNNFQIVYHVDRWHDLKPTLQDNKYID